MSRPGYWKTKEGIEVAYADMETSHVCHVLRFLRNRYISSPTSLYKNYFEQKLVELGAEAQRRNIIPSGDVQFDQLLSIVEGWQRDWDSRHGSQPVTFVKDPVAMIDKVKKTGAIKSVKKLPLSMQVIEEISIVTNLPISMDENMLEEGLYRNLTTEL